MMTRYQIIKKAFGSVEKGRRYYVHRFFIYRNTKEHGVACVETIVNNEFVTKSIDF